MNAARKQLGTDWHLPQSCWLTQALHGHVTITQDSLDSAEDGGTACAWEATQRQVWLRFKARRDELLLALLLEAHAREADSWAGSRGVHNREEWALCCRAGKKDWSREMRGAGWVGALFRFAHARLEDPHQRQHVGEQEAGGQDDGEHQGAALVVVPNRLAAQDLWGGAWGRGGQAEQERR